MSTIKVDAITDEAGTGAPNFPNGMTGDGSALTGLPLPSAVAALTPAATVDIDLTTNDHFTLTLDQDTTFTLSNVTTVDTFNLQLTGYTITDSRYDLDVASFNAQSAQTSLQGGDMQGLVFKTDGTSMFVSNRTNDSVHQYTLSTAWDVSTASYASKSFSVAAQTGTGQDVTLSTDGTSMYIVENTSDNVYQYTLSTPWDVSTASYASKSFSVGSQSNWPRDVMFLADGASMFVIDDVNDTIYQYTLSTPWDVSTASYASKSFNPSSTSASSLSMSFNNDGTLLYVLGTSYVFQYDVDGSVFATLTYPSTLEFPNGVVPIAPEVGIKNVLDFFTTDGGATWYANQIGEDYK